MNPKRMLLGAAGAALCAVLFACGGGSSSPPAAPVSELPAAQAPMALAFEELWEPRVATCQTPDAVASSTGIVQAPSAPGWVLPGASADPCDTGNGVFGAVGTRVLINTPDGSDPQQDWASNNITGRWGTLAGLDGTVPGLPNVTGNGPTPSWSIDAGRLAFHGSAVIGAAGSADGFALISKQKFQRNRRIVVEADVSLTAGSDKAFAGLALIAGEGDYREIAFRRTAGVDYIMRCTPLRETLLIARPPGTVTFRIEYDPVDGFRYLVNGQVVGTEAIDHEGASFAADPQVGLYFAANPTVHGSFADGSVGPVRVWTN